MMGSHGKLIRKKKKILYIKNSYKEIKARKKKKILCTIMRNKITVCYLRSASL